MLACLATIEPLDTATGTRTTIRVSSVNDRANGALVNGLNGQVWEPALVEAPVLGLTLWNGDFTAAVSPAGATLPLKMEVVKGTYTTADTLAWIGAPVSIYAEAPGTAWPWTKRFAGRVRSFGRRGQTLTLTAEVDVEPLNANILTAVYAGTGGAEGGADLKNRVKPLAIGWTKNVEPVLIDTTNNVYQFSAYGAIEAVTTLFERGSDFGASQGDYATYAALVAATIPAGKWGTSLAVGMIRLGAPAFGVITGDIKGHKVGATTPRLTGAIINALATIAGVSAGDIDTATLTALDAAVAYSANLLLTEQATFFDQARTMAIACNYQAGASLIGKFFVAKVSLTGSVVLELEAAGKRSPQVFQSDEADVSVPYWRTALGANRAWRVHSADEIAFAAELVERGLYDAAATYREGNIVNLADGSRWLYIFATATSGNAPPTWPTTSNTWWSALTGPTNASWSAVVNDNGARPSDYAGVTNSLTKFGAGTGVQAGNTLTKASADAWNLGWYTNETARGNGLISAQAVTATGNIQVVLSKLTDKTVSLTGYGFQLSVGTIFPWLGTANGSSIGTYVAGDTIAATYDGVEMRYFKNGAFLTSVVPDVSYATADLLAQVEINQNTISVRSFIFAPNTASNYALIGGETRPSDYAGTTLNLNTVTSGAGALTRTGNSAVKTAGAGAYNAALVSADQFIGAVEASWCSAGSAFQDILVGLSTTGATAIADTDLTYAWSGAPGGTPTVYEAGVLKYTAGFSLSATDVLKVVANGLTIKYYANGGLEYTSAATPSHTQSYRFKATIAGVGAKVTDIIVTPTNNAAFSAVGGTDKPADNATVNIVTRSASAPGSPVNGDVWVDTSVTPNVTKVRVSGAWQAGANYTTEGSHIGVENTADITGFVTGAPIIQILCDHTGAVKAGQLTKTSGYKAYKAGTDVTTSAAWSVTTLTGTCTVTIGAATGVLSLTAISTDCRLRVNAVYGGRTYSQTINLERVLDTPPTGGSAGGGTTASVEVGSSVNSTTHAAITTSDLYVTAGTNGQIVLTGGGAFGHDTNDASLHVYTIIQKWNGSAFADIGTHDQSTEPSRFYSGEEYWEGGVFGSGDTDTGLTAGVEYRYRMTGRTFSGTVVRYFSGTLTGVGT